MKKNHPKPQLKSGSANDAELENRVFRGLLAEGYIVAETPDEVRATEPESTTDEHSVPPALNNSDAVLRRIQHRIASREAKTIPFPLPQETGVEEELCRAARHGSKLPREIKAKMEKNRRKADRKGGRDDAAK